jgi:hypothetical protein
VVGKEREIEQSRQGTKEDDLRRRWDLIFKMANIKLVTPQEKERERRRMMREIADNDNR